MENIVTDDASGRKYKAILHLFGGVCVLERPVAVNMITQFQI